MEYKLLNILDPEYWNSFAIKYDLTPEVVSDIIKIIEKAMSEEYGIIKE